MGKRGPVVVPVELREMALKVTPLLLVIAIGITIVLGSLPMLLIALAYALVELAGFPIWLAMLSSSVAGMAAGGVTVLIAIRRLRPHLTIWRRSATELRENVDFLKGKISPSDFRPPNNKMSNRPQAHRQGRQGVQEHSVVDNDQ